MSDINSLRKCLISKIDYDLMNLFESKYKDVIIIESYIKQNQYKYCEIYCKYSVDKCVMMTSVIAPEIYKDEIELKKLVLDVESRIVNYIERNNN